MQYSHHKYYLLGNTRMKGEKFRMVEATLDALIKLRVLVGAHPKICSFDLPSKSAVDLKLDFN